MPVKINPFDSVIPKLVDVARYWRTIVRSGLIGTFIGILPGVGEDVAAWSSYAAAKRASKEREKFGKGSIEGLMAAETGDNACVPGAIIPVLTLGIPGSAPAAVLMAAMLIHGVRPGPLIMTEAPTFVYDVVAMMMFATFGILLYGLTLTKLLIKVLIVPKAVILPIIFVLCVVGSYAIASRLFDVWVMLGFGVLGYVLRRAGYPVAPLVLGLVLGDLMEKGLRRGLVLSDGSLLPFFTRPISAVLWVTIVLVILMKFEAVRKLFRRVRPPRRSALKAHMKTIRLGIIMNGVTGTHGHEPASRALDRGHSRARRRRARQRRPRHARSRSSSDATRTSSPRSPRPTASSASRPISTARSRNAADAVFFDAATTQMRPELLRRAIAAGKHVYCEKPTATTLEQALDIARTRRARGRQERRGAGQALPAGLHEAAHAARRRLLRPHAVGARRVRLLGVRRRPAARAAALVELSRGGRRRHHPRHDVPLALRARQPRSRR